MAKRGQIDILFLVKFIVAAVIILAIAMVFMKIMGFLK